MIVLDIETLPLDAALAAPYPEGERQPPANYTKPETIAAWREKDRVTWAEQRVKECSLTPRLGRICALALCDADPKEGIKEGDRWCGVAQQEGDERILIERAFTALGLHRGEVVTFRGGFDLRFLLIRAAASKVPASIRGRDVREWFRRYSLTPHFDCRAALTGWDDFQPGTLSEWCAFFGIPCEDACSGADIYPMAQAGEWEKISAHCLNDIGMTRSLYRRIAPYFI